MADHELWTGFLRKMNSSRELHRRRMLGFLIGLPLMLVFQAVGTVGAFKGGSQLWLEYELQQRGIATVGEVIRSVARRTGPAQSQQKRSWREITYQFSTEAGTQRRTVEVEMYQHPPRTGDEISIHYLPENPEHNWPLEFSRGWWNWFIVGFGALVAVFSAVVVVGMLAGALKS